MTRKPSSEFGKLAMLAALAALLAAPAGPAAAATAARVTGALGDSNSGGDPLSLRGNVDEGDPLETGDDGECTLLVDEDAVMEVCGDTLLRLERKGGTPDGARIVKLDRGSIRLVVEPRLGEEKIEIHTPAAIATVLGTIVHVSVSAVGAMEVISETSKVLVETLGPVPQQRQIDSNEMLTVGVDGAMGQTEKVSADDLRRAGGVGCIVSLNMHHGALNSDRTKASEEQVEDMREADTKEATLNVASPLEPHVIPADPPPKNPPFTPVDTVSESLMDMGGEPPCFPGETTCP